MGHAKPRSRGRGDGWGRMLPGLRASSARLWGRVFDPPRNARGRSGFEVAGWGRGVAELARFASDPGQPGIGRPAMNPFLPFLIGSVVLACAWTILAVGIDRRRQFMGLIGAWVSTAVLAALWQAKAVPWLWIALKAVLVVWMCAIALLITAAVSIRGTRESGRRAFLFCAVASAVVSVASGLWFLWLATVSSGGV
jgi:hypothetical protein